MVSDAIHVASNQNKISISASTSLMSNHSKEILSNYDKQIKEYVRVAQFIYETGIRAYADTYSDEPSIFYLANK